MKIEALFSVSGKVALVTGGSRGIGEMIAAGLLANGATVYISSRKTEACEVTAKRLTDTYGGTCVPLPANVASREGAQSLADQFGEREQRLDILVNNAGATWGSTLADFPETGWDKVMDTNVKGVFFLVQSLLPRLEAAATADDPARIVNIGSIDGIRVPLWETYSYSASKAALHALTKHLAGRLVRRNILVNGIAPGAFPTEMLSAGLGQPLDQTDWDGLGEHIPRGRVGTPEDIAGLVIFLCSRAGGYVVGDVIACDGGALVG